MQLPRLVLWAVSVISFLAVERAQAQVAGSSDAAGVIVGISVDGSAELELAPVPFVQGAAPPAYDNVNSVASVAAISGLLGTVVETGVAEVQAASDLPGTTISSSRSTVENLEVAIGGLLTLLGVTATEVESTAQVSGECGVGLAPSGSTAIVDGEAIVSGVVGVTVLSSAPAPNSEPLLISLGPLAIRMILNEQIITGDGVDVSSITVNAIHIELTGANIPLVGSVRGDIIIGQSQATIDCTLPPPCEDFARSASFGESVRLRLGGVLEMSSGPLPVSAGLAPPSYLESNSLVGIALSNLIFGSVLTSGTLDADAESDFPSTASASADASVESLDTSILGVLVSPFLDLTADVVASDASVAGECGMPLVESGSTTLANALASVLGVAQGTLAANPAANSEPLAGVLPPEIRLILNEQIVTGDGTTSRGITVNAIHLIIDDIDIPLLGTLAGDVIVSQSQAEIQCAACSPSIGVAKSAGTVVDQGDGSFVVPIVFTVENLGNVGLANVQVTDDFSVVFPGAATFSIESDPTSPGLSVNPGFDGDTDTNLLLGTDFLAPGSVAQILLSVRFTPNGESGPFLNQAIVTAEDPLGNPVNDSSDDGFDPDPNGNGNADELGENDPTPIDFAANPVIGLAKAATPTVDNGNGTFTTMISIVVANLGNVPLSNIQVVDDLAVAVPGGTCSVSGLAASGTLTSNPGFDGLCSGGSADLLIAGASALAVGETETISFAFTFDPGGGASPLFNQAFGEAEGPSGDPTEDASDAGTEPDANGNGDPGDVGEDDPTVIPFADAPQVGVAKAAGAVVDNGDGTFSVAITISVANLGNTPLVLVDVVDDLSLTFPAPATCTVTSGPAVSGSLTANPAYDGNCGGGSTSLLLPGSSTLPIGASETIVFTVEFDPGTGTAFFNTAIATAESPGGTPTTDESTDGTDPDPNDNGDPGDVGEDVPTPLVPEATVQIGVAKQAGAIVNNGDGTFTVPITLHVENLGSVALNQVQIVEDLAATFPLPTTFSVAAPPIAAGTLAANPGFNGSTDTNLLVAAASTLAPGVTLTVSLSVTFSPNGAPGPYFDQVIASGSDPDGVETSDLSDDGIEPDPNGNGDPGDAGENDPTPITPQEDPVIGLAKTATRAERVGMDTYRTIITIFVENLGDVPLSAISVVDDLTLTFPAPTTFAVISGPLTTGTLVANPLFDGVGVTETLVPASSTLAVGATAQVRFTVEFTLNGAVPLFLNSAVGEGTGPLGGDTTDTSDSGTDPDPNGNGDPGEVGEDDPTPIVLVAPAPMLGAAGLALAAALALLVGVWGLAGTRRSRRETASV